MNRREALAALGAVPSLAIISKTQVQRGDVVVVHCPGSVSPEVAERIDVFFKKHFPDQRCLVLGDGMTVSVLSCQ